VCDREVTYEACACIHADGIFEVVHAFLIVGVCKGGYPRQPQAQCTDTRYESREGEGANARSASFKEYRSVETIIMNPPVLEREREPERMMSLGAPEGQREAERVEGKSRRGSLPERRKSSSRSPPKVEGAENDVMSSIASVVQQAYDFSIVGMANAVSDPKLFAADGGGERSQMPQLSEQEVGLGMALERDKEGVVYVQEVLRGFAAWHDGNIQEDDTLVSISGNITHFPTYGDIIALSAVSAKNQAVDILSSPALFLCLFSPASSSPLPSLFSRVGVAVRGMSPEELRRMTIGQVGTSVRVFMNRKGHHFETLLVRRLPNVKSPPIPPFLPFSLPFSLPSFLPPSPPTPPSQPVSSTHTNPKP